MKITAFGEDILRSKYIGEHKHSDGYYRSLAKNIARDDTRLEQEAFKLFTEGRFIPGGRILAFAGRPNSTVSLMNCTAHAIEGDSLEAIAHAAHTIMKASSRGQGIGVDLSSLRPKEARVNNAAKTSTGAISFMELLNSVGATIGQEGRRAALLFSLRVDHPDLWRKDAEDIDCPRCHGQGCMACKGKGKIPYDFLHIKSIPGRVENANISVVITGAFMRAVQQDQPWEMRFTGESGGKEFTVSRTVPARELFLEIARNAWASAEPGVLFIDNARAMSNSDLFGKRWGIVTTNACGEQWLDQEGVCNLGSMNLGSYVLDPYTRDARFDFDQFGRDIDTAVRFLDSAIDVELHGGRYTSEKQFDSLRALRRIGLGVMGYADVLVKMGLKYEYNPATVDFTSRVFSYMRDAAYLTSVNLAQEKGMCGVWGELSFAEREEILGKAFYSTLPDFVKDAILINGLRNAVLLSIAPTGSISNLVGASSGIEPLFAREYIRRVRMHGSDEFITYVHPGVEETRALGIPDSVWQTAYEVAPEHHIALQAVIQQFIDSSISKTVNLPKTATVDDVANAYMMAWELGLKGVSVYRDGSRDAAVLHAVETPEKESCPNCGEAVVKNGGCVECKHCGWSRCS